MGERIVIIFLFVVLAFFDLQAQTPEDSELWEPEPEMISFLENQIPKDAIVLFDGSNLDHWEHEEGQPVKWRLQDGVLTVSPKSGDIFTKEKFGSCQLHLEWKSPKDIISNGQERGNSGLFFQSLYEVQILDSYKNRTYSNGQAGSIYKQHIPLVNASKPPDVWQTYDVIFTAPIFDGEGKKIKPGYLTVFHNNVLIQNHVEIQGSTEYIGEPKNRKHGLAPLKLQDHGNLVSFRNIWLRKL